MGVAWPIPNAFRHFTSILFFIIMLIVNIYAYVSNNYINDTHKVMVGIILIISIVLCAITGRSLKERKIQY